MFGDKNDVLLNMNSRNQSNVEEAPCWSEKIIPMIAMYMVICSLLYMTGMIDIRHGSGVNLLIGNLLVMILFASYIMMYPENIYVGGCV